MNAMQGDYETREVVSKIPGPIKTVQPYSNAILLMVLVLTDVLNRKQ